ncbi:hypothetical protein ACE38W_21840 [Chitinophaga sp. Hz27]|uniref:hypothetical protein n=1 Tax=Chitinophaga sp. Hz27 TaxID=3347169 RepID=UPI0035E133F8
MLQSRYLIWLLTAFLIIAGCSPEPKKPGIYFWDQVYFPLTQKAKLPIDSFGSLYLRYFDVTWNATYNAAVPMPVYMYEYSDSSFYGNAILIPVIHIENAVLEKTPFDSILPLALNIIQKTETISRNILTKTKKEWGREIQYDCEWTPDTKEKYWELLKYLTGNQYGKQLTVTVTLAAFKDRTAYGIPPVTGAMLKCYDYGDTARPVTANANLELEKLKTYFTDTSVYPLPLGMQFPVAARFNLYRNGAFMGVPNLQSNIMSNGNLFMPTDGGSYILGADTTWAGTILKKGDLLKKAIIDPGVLANAVRYLKATLPQYDMIAFNNWNPPITYRYDTIMRPLLQPKKLEASKK